MFNQFIRKGFVSGLESFGNVDAPTGATNCARGSNPDENSNLIRTGEAVDSLDRFKTSTIGKALLICDSDSCGSVGHVMNQLRICGITKLDQKCGNSTRRTFWNTLRQEIFGVREDVWQE